MYSRQMADAARQRERVLLETVARSEGQWSTRDIDFEVSRQAAPGELTVLDELKNLERDGFVARVQCADDASFVGWRITPEGTERLAAMMP
jgi:DNA-binding HxlR family transcriptional regulator